MSLIHCKVVVHTQTKDLPFWSSLEYGVRRFAVCAFVYIRRLISGIIPQNPSEQGLSHELPTLASQTLIVGEDHFGVHTQKKKKNANVLLE